MDGKIKEDFNKMSPETRNCIRIEANRWSWNNVEKPREWVLAKFAKKGVKL